MSGENENMPEGTFVIGLPKRAGIKIKSQGTKMISNKLTEK